MNFNIAIDAAEVQGVINGLPQLIFRAQRSAIGTTTTYAKNEMENRLAVSTGIPRYLFRRFRVNAKRSQERGIVWVGLNEIKATYVGKLFQSGTGAFAGQYYFEGGFIANMKSGHTGIFKRIGADRLGIEEQTVTIDAGFMVAEEVAELARIELRNRFADKVRELNPHIV